MDTQLLDSLSKSVGVVLVLSLAVERLALLFKRRDWQPLSLRWWPHSLRFGRFAKSSSVFHIDLRTERVYDPYAHGRGEVAATRDEKQTLLRTVNGENTALIGLGLALLTRADAFAGLGFANASTGFAPVAEWLRIVATGLAAGVGSSFWYDVLRLIVWLRKRDAAALEKEAPGPSPLAVAQGTTEDTMRFRKVFRAAEQKAKKLSVGGRIVRVVPMLKNEPRDLGIGLLIANGEVPKDAESGVLAIEVPEEPKPLAIPILTPRTRSEGSRDGD